MLRPLFKMAAIFVIELSRRGAAYEKGVRLSADAGGKKGLLQRRWFPSLDRSDKNLLFL